MTIAEIIGMLLGSGVIGGLVTALLARGKTKAEATQIITEAAGNMVEKLEQQLHELQAETKAQREEINTLRAAVLRMQVDVDARDQRIAVLTDDGRRKDEEISALKCRVAELETEVRNLRADNERLRNCNEGE